MIATNPATEVDLPRTTPAKVRPWEPAELGQFLDHIAADPLSALFELIAGTGLRRGEAAGLRWADVDLAAGRLYVQQQIVSVINTEPCTNCGAVDRGAD